MCQEWRRIGWVNEWKNWLQKYQGCYIRCVCYSPKDHLRAVKTLGKSLLQFHVALTWFSWRWEKSSTKPGNLVSVQKVLKRFACPCFWVLCTVISTGLSISVKAGHLKSCLSWMQGLWTCHLVQLWRKGWGEGVPLSGVLDWCSALVCSMCPLLTTELLKTILDLPLHTLPLLCSPWFLQPGILTFVFPTVNCGGPAVCRLPTSSFFPGCRN